MLTSGSYEVETDTANMDVTQDGVNMNLKTFLNTNLQF
jgi:hypothetical protein